jgi:hypothetical protein
MDALLNHQDLSGILFMTFMFGGGALWFITMTIAENWRKVRIAEQNAVLKKTMLDRGFTAEEIVAVINANGSSKAKITGNQALKASCDTA